MILTPEEQAEAREEIDYMVEMNGYEYVWGKETGMDKLRGFSRDAPSKVIDGLTKIANNPTVVAINEKLAAHNAKLNAEEGNGQSQGNGNQMLNGIGSGSGFGGLQQAPIEQPQQQQRYPAAEVCPQCHSNDAVRRSGERVGSHQWYCGRCDNWFYTKGKRKYQNPPPKTQSRNESNGMFDNNPLGNNPLGEHPLQRKGSDRRSNPEGSGLHFGGDHL